MPEQQTSVRELQLPVARLVISALATYSDGLQNRSPASYSEGREAAEVLDFHAQQGITTGSAADQATGGVVPASPHPTAKHTQKQR